MSMRSPPPGCQGLLPRGPPPSGEPPESQGLERRGFSGPRPPPRGRVVPFEEPPFEWSRASVPRQAARAASLAGSQPNSVGLRRGRGQIYLERRSEGRPDECEQASPRPNELGFQPSRPARRVCRGGLEALPAEVSDTIDCPLFQPRPVVFGGRDGGGRRLRGGRSRAQGTFVRGSHPVDGQPQGRPGVLEEPADLGRRLRARGCPPRREQHEVGGPRGRRGDGGGLRQLPLLRVARGSGQPPGLGDPPPPGSIFPFAAGVDPA